MSKIQSKCLVCETIMEHYPYQKKQFCSVHCVARNRKRLRKTKGIIHSFETPIKAEK